MKMREMETEIKRLQHHISLLSKRNHSLVEDGKRRAAPPVATGAFLREVRDEGWKEEVAEEVVAEVVEEERVVAGSVVSFKEAAVAEPVVRLPMAVQGE